MHLSNEKDLISKSLSLGLELSTKKRSQKKLKIDTPRRFAFNLDQVVKFEKTFELIKRWESYKLCSLAQINFGTPVYFAKCFDASIGLD